MTESHENHEFERGRDGRSTDIETGGGTPDWLASHLNYCSRCGSRLRFGAVDGEHRERLVCDTCGHIVYVNPRIVVTAFPITDDGDLVLLRRGIEPGYGDLGTARRFPRGRRDRQPGGDPRDPRGDRPARRARRDHRAVHPAEAAVVTIAFEARIVGGAPMVTPEALEVRSFAPADIPWDGIAFNTTQWALRDWLALRHPELTAPETTHATF